MVVNRGKETLVSLLLLMKVTLSLMLVMFLAVKVVSSGLVSNLRD